VPYQREAEIVSSMWREVERDLQAAEIGSREAEDLQADAARLRDEHQRLTRLALDHHRPIPAPMPEAHDHPEGDDTSGGGSRAPAGHVVIDRRDPERSDLEPPATIGAP
jgi:hypothetical protein